MAEKTSLFDSYLNCHICSETFRDPVSLKCHHSFCCNCLKKFWEQTDSKNCPTCKRKSSMDPDINLALKELADSYDGRQKAESSGEDVKMLCCKHTEEQKLFCEEEQRAVCHICDSSDHHGHKLIPIEQAVSNLKDEIKSDLKALKVKRNKWKQVEQSYNQVVQHSKKQVVATERQIKAEIEKLHKFLRDVEEIRLADLREEAEQKGKIVSREMKIIQEQISSLSDSISAVEQELQKDNESFLSSYKHIQTSAKVQCTLSEPQLNSGMLIDVAKHKANLTFGVWENIKEKVKINPVLLDPNTANPSLCLSDDLTSLKYTVDTMQTLPDNPERFTNSVSVLGSEGFSSGKHSWVVEVGNYPNWTIGLATENVERKRNISPTPSNGMWYLCYRDGDGYYDAGRDLSVQRNPERIRVQLDYDMGEVSFYDHEDMTLIYTLKDTFTEKLYPLFSVGPAGNAETTDIKIYQIETSLPGMSSGACTDFWEGSGSAVKKRTTSQTTTHTKKKRLN